MMSEKCRASLGIGKESWKESVIVIVNRCLKINDKNICDASPIILYNPKNPKTERLDY